MKLLTIFTAEFVRYEENPSYQCDYYKIQKMLIVYCWNNLFIYLCVCECVRPYVYECE